MSMLAEKKRKQKWALNPQGKHWLSDSNKFGLKILEGLGWKEGKGLGKQQDGIKEPIKISYKNDNKGLGLKETQRSLQQEHFNNLLESLNNDTSNNPQKPISSLEQKSLKSRSRVHYKKFTRGKDLSRYSAQDLASIFEKKSKEPVVDPPVDKNINMGSMTDYFKNRAPSLRFRDENSDEEHQSVGFGFKNPAFEPLGQNFTLVKHTLEPIVETEIEKDLSVIVDEQSCDLGESEVKCKRKKSKQSESEKKAKKKKKKSKMLSQDGGVDNLALQINDPVNDDTEVNDVVPTKKKDKKKKKIVAEMDENVFVDSNSVVDSNHQEQVPTDLNPKMKKRKKCAIRDDTETEGLDNPAFNPASSSDIQCDLMLNVVDEPEAVQRKRPKMHKKSKNFGCDNYGFDSKSQRIEETMASLSNNIETYQAEVENDMNECKDAEICEEDMMVGELTDSGGGENERRDEGILLRYKHAAFTKDPYWAARHNQSVSLARKSYKHLIRGDIMVGFKKSNLHEIIGYGNTV